MVGVTTPLFSDYFSYAAPRRTRRLAADEAEAEEARPDTIIGREQPIFDSRAGTRRRRSVGAAWLNRPATIGEFRRQRSCAEPVGRATCHSLTGGRHAW